MNECFQIFTILKYYYLVMSFTKCITRYFCKVEKETNNLSRNTYSLLLYSQLATTCTIEEITIEENKFRPSVWKGGTPRPPGDSDLAMRSQFPLYIWCVEKMKYERI